MLRRNEETASTKRKLQTIPLVQPFCLDFNDAPNLDGFDKCPGIYDNIQVKHSTVQTNGDPQDHSEPGDGYIHLRDLSGGSIACAEGGPLIGDWSEVACQANCYELCYDFNLFYDGCQSKYTTARADNHDK